MATMNAGLILAGQPVNALNALSGGIQTAGQANDVRHTSNYRNALAQYGAGAIGGDQESINALAGFDPGAALGIQQTRQSMAHADERMKLARAAGARAAAGAARSRSAAELERAREEMKRGIAAASTAQTPEEWDALAQQFGADELVGQFGQRDAVIAYYTGLDETLDRMVPPAPADEYQRYVQEETAAGREPLTRIDFPQAKKGQEIVYGADGRPVLVRGPAGMDMSFTEQQSKDNVYATRARGALGAFEPVADSLTSRGERVAGYIPLGIGREMQSDEFQVANQAGDEFLQAILRKDTGAAITQGEMDSYGQTYLPQPGDGPAVLETKRQARIRAVNALESGMSPAQMLARDSALVSASREGTPGGIEIIPSESVRTMSPEQIRALGPGAITRLDLSNLNGLSPEQWDALEALAAQGG